MLPDMIAALTAAQEHQQRKASARAHAQAQPRSRGQVVPGSMAAM